MNADQQPNSSVPPEEPTPYAEDTTFSKDEATSSVPAPATQQEQVLAVEGESTTEAQQPVPADGPEPVVAPVVAPVAAPINSKKPKKLAPILIALVAVLVIGGGAAAYKFWYQNANKVVHDSLQNLLTEDGPVTSAGTFTFKSDDANVVAAFSSALVNKTAKGNVTVTFSGDKGVLKGKTLTLKGEGVYAEDGNLYFKADDLKKTAIDFTDIYIENLASEYEAMGYTITDDQVKSAKEATLKQVTTVVSKVDGQWIKVSADDMKKNDEEASKEYVCYTDVVKRLTNSKDGKDGEELSKIYKENTFIVVKKELGSKDGSLGYEIEVDKTKLKEFQEKAKDTAIVKAFNDCDKDSSSASDTEASEDSTTTEVKAFQVWVDRWSHKLTSVTNETVTIDKANKETASAKLNATMDYSKSVTVETPQNAKSFTELMESLESIGSTTTGTV